MQTHILEKRLTHKYVGTYKHLDSWQTLAYFKVEARSVIKHNEEERYDEDGYELEVEYDPCDPQTEILFGLVYDLEEGVTTEDIQQALIDTFSSHGCAHEYDCCGCRSYNVSTVNQLGNNYWRVAIHSSRNF